jgi:hypothetical protein
VGGPKHLRRHVRSRRKLTCARKAAILVLAELAEPLFFLCIAFLPFPTQVLNEYMLDSANQTTAATF